MCKCENIERRLDQLEFNNAIDKIERMQNEIDKRLDKINEALDRRI